MPTKQIEFIRSKSKSPLDIRSKEIRKTILKMVEKAGRGHIPTAFSLVEILRVLYDDVLKFDSKNPFWKERDRCILSKGHGCLALYPLLADKGFFPEEELWKVCKPDGILGGHPEYKKVPGVEASTGSLGHGLPIGCGMALDAKIHGRENKVFVVMGDGECHEGSVWEAAMFANKHQLDNLCVVVDYNKQVTYNTTFQVQDLEPFAEKWKSFGFHAIEIDGHDTNLLRNTFKSIPLSKGKPTAIICHTIKGFGVPSIEINFKWHHINKITPKEVAGLINELENNK